MYNILIQFFYLCILKNLIINATNKPDINTVQNVNINIAK